ncbi:MAG: hypothetical protein INR68_10395 [Methylobacterium mesophilicum]|nr:hypothetical protein [Methylobacterium mesophilicum]
MLGSLILGTASAEAGIAVKRLKAAFAAYALGGVLVLLGLGFLLLAAYAWTAERYGPIHAALGFGGGFLVLGAILILAYRVSSARRRRLDEARRAAEARSLATTAAITTLPAALASRQTVPLIGLAGAFAVGYAIFRENRRLRPFIRHMPPPPPPFRGPPPF